jgi:CelD/BcsL family acetyltransferase involved in cellulose biosynthesis
MMSAATTQIATYKPVSAPVNKLAALPKMSCEFLAEADYPLWNELVTKSPHGTVFQNSWWLAIAATSFRILVVRDQEGRIVGGIPLPSRNAKGLKLLHSPGLAPYLGPIFDLSSADGTCDQLHLMRSYGEALARGIGPYDSFRFIAGAQAPDLQGFLWAGFNASLAYTFRFSATQSLDEITSGITRTHLQKLNKAKRLNLKITRNAEIQALLELNKMTFERKGVVQPYSGALIRQLWEESHAHGQANLYIAKTEEGRPVAGLFTVHDARTTYQIVSGFDPSVPDIPGQNLVLWTALQDAIEAGRNYDFEGSGLRGVETFYRRWGCSAVPVWKLEKAGTFRGALAQLAIQYQDRKQRSRISSSH